MPQVFQVLKCYKCGAFQIHQSKKSSKFECKICGEKQSIKRHYGIGTGKECRLHVQKLNALRGDIEERFITKSDSDEEEYGDGSIDKRVSNTFFKPIKHRKRSVNKINDSDEEYGCSDDDKHVQGGYHRPTKQSKWSAFVDVDENTTKEDTKLYMRDKEVLLEIPQKRKTEKFKYPTRISSNIKGNTCYDDNFCNTLETNMEKSSVSNFELRDISKSSHGCLLSQVEVSNQSTISNKQKFSLKQNDLQATIECSKWAEYIDPGEENKDKDSDFTSNEPNKTLTNHLFALCDDNDLDKVLEM